MPFRRLVAYNVWLGSPMDPKTCRRAVNRRLRALPNPKDMIPAERMAAKAILAPCKACGGCERAL